MWHLLKLSWKCLTGNLPIVCSLVSNQTPPRSCKEKGSGVTSPYSSRSMKWPMKSQSSDYWNNAETTSIVHSKWYEIHYWHWPVYNPTLTITFSVLPQAQGFGLETPDPFSSCELSGVWARDVNPFVASFWYSTSGSGSGHKTRHVPLEAKRKTQKCITGHVFLVWILRVWVQHYLEGKRN